MFRLRQLEIIGDAIEAAAHPISAYTRNPGGCDELSRLGPAGNTRERGAVVPACWYRILNETAAATQKRRRMFLFLGGGTGTARALHVHAPIHAHAHTHCCRRASRRAIRIARRGTANATTRPRRGSSSSAAIGKPCLLAGRRESIALRRPWATRVTPRGCTTRGGRAWRRAN